MTGSELRRRREALRWTQADLAARANVSVDYIRKIEGGSRQPAAKTTRAILGAIEEAEQSAQGDGAANATWIASHPDRFATAVDLVLQIGPGVVEHLLAVRKMQREWEAKQDGTPDTLEVDP